MWRQAIGRAPTLVEGQTNGATPKANERPWTSPWWQPSEGNGATLFYIVMIHALALVGLVLFPLPGWRVLAVALAVAAIGGVGTSVCYHRCLAHRSLRLNPVVENALIFFTIFNASGAPLTWVAQHRPESLVAWVIAIGSVGRELAQESSRGCELGSLRAQVVADRHWLVCDPWAQVIKASERCQATERIPQAGERGKEGDGGVQFHVCN